MLDLLQLAPRILVDLALARKDVQGLEQLDGLAGAQVELIAGVLRFGSDKFGFGHGLILRSKFLMCCAVV